MIMRKFEREVKDVFKLDKGTRDEIKTILINSFLEKLMNKLLKTNDR